MGREVQISFTMMSTLPQGHSKSVQRVPMKAGSISLVGGEEQRCNVTVITNSDLGPGPLFRRTLAVARSTLESTIEILVVVIMALHPLPG